MRGRRRSALAVRRRWHAAAGQPAHRLAPGWYMLAGPRFGHSEAALKFLAATILALALCACGYSGSKANLPENLNQFELAEIIQEANQLQDSTSFIVMYFDVSNEVLVTPDRFEFDVNYKA